MAKKIYYAVLSVALFLVASNSFAAILPLVQCGNPAPSPYTAPCTFTDLVAMVGRLVSFALEYIAIPVTAVMVAWGGITMAISAGNENKFGKGKKIVTGAAVGLLISLGAWIIVNSVMGFLQISIK